MRKLFLGIITLIGVPFSLYQQANVDLKERIKDFGFNTQQVTAFTTNVNGSFDIVFETNEIIYINNSNQICEYKKISGAWTNMGVLNSAAPAIRNGCKIIKTGNKIFYVSNSNSKIYQLTNTSGTTWTQILLLNSQTLVRGDADILYSFPHLYYIGTNNYVCELLTQDGGTTWIGGSALNSTSTIARSGTNIIQPINTNLIYYVDAQNRISELAYSPTLGWTIGSATYTNTNVKTNSKIATDGYSIYYIRTIGTITVVNVLYWTSSGWQITGLPYNENIRPDIDLKVTANTVFFVGATTGKINILSRNTSGLWSAIAPISESTVVKLNSKLLVYSNFLYEEGSWQTFESQNLFYTDVNNKLVFLVFDDSPCLNTYNMLWNTEACKVGGAFPKAWHFGPELLDAVNTVNSNINISQNAKDIYFVNSLNQVKVLNRNTPNNNINYNNLGSGLSFSDEFTSLTNTQSKWNPQFPNGNVHQGGDKAHYNDYNNFSISSDVLNIETKQENTNFQYWRMIDSPWSPDCHAQHYDYSSGSLHTGCYNCDPYFYYSNPYPTTGPLLKLVDCGPTAKPHTFYQKYGWFEMRTKLPRGKGLWNAFWLLPKNYTWDNEIDVFEVPGNGKYIAQTNWTEFIFNSAGQITGRHSHAKIIDCIGYRAYEDYHTYAVKWSATGIEFYYDNKKVGYTLIDYIPSTDEMYMLVNGYTKSVLSDGHMMIESEVENFPNYWQIDYVRSYAEINTPKSFQSNNIYTRSIEIYPQPASSFFSIKTSEEWETLSIYDMNSKLIKTVTYNADNNYDIADIKPGVYIIEIANKGEIFREKFIKVGQ